MAHSTTVNGKMIYKMDKDLKYGRMFLISIYLFIKEMVLLTKVNTKKAKNTVKDISK
jgi:hypothetical protein